MHDMVGFAGSGHPAVGWLGGWWPEGELGGCEMVGWFAEVLW